jgi:hypothetical protein
MASHTISLADARRSARQRIEEVAAAAREAWYASSEVSVLICTPQFELALSEEMAKAETEFMAELQRLADEAGDGEQPDHGA